MRWIIPRRLDFSNPDVDPVTYWHFQTSLLGTRFARWR